MAGLWAIGGLLLWVLADVASLAHPNSKGWAGFTAHDVYTYLGTLCLAYAVVRVIVWVLTKLLRQKRDEFVTRTNDFE